jgi:hypothetical protein
MTQDAGDRKKNLRAKGRLRHFAISFHWVQGSPLPPAAQAIILSFVISSSAPSSSTPESSPAASIFSVYAAA